MTLSISPFPPTPYLAVDAGIVERNLAAMADKASARGLALRPHAKTHKVVELAQRQIGLGAVGLTVATVGEAEVFAQSGIADIFIAFPVWADSNKGSRLAALADNLILTVGVDSADGARQLAAATAGSAVNVLIEIDSGHHRSGTAPEDAGRVALAAAGAGLSVRGVFTFPGHGYGPGEQGRAAADESRSLAAAAAGLAAVGLSPEVISGGSTPTAEAADASILTELRPGVYLFNDAQQLEMGTC
ncbi:MAG TPA: alanine racemase, partial [Micrococcaceae bacterium]